MAALLSFIQHLQMSHQCMGLLFHFCECAYGTLSERTGRWGWHTRIKRHAGIRMSPAVCTAVSPGPTPPCPPPSCWLAACLYDLWWFCALGQVCSLTRPINSSPSNSGSAMIEQHARFKVPLEHAARLLMHAAADASSPPEVGGTWLGVSTGEHSSGSAPHKHTYCHHPPRLLFRWDEGRPGRDRPACEPG